MQSWCTGVILGKAEIAICLSFNLPFFVSFVKRIAASLPVHLSWYKLA